MDDNKNTSTVNIAFKLDADIHQKVKALSWQSQVNLSKLFPFIVKQFVNDNEDLFIKAAMNVRAYLEQPLQERVHEELAHTDDQSKVVLR